jgi:hypothetical protein
MEVDVGLAVGLTVEDGVALLVDLLVGVALLEPLLVALAVEVADALGVALELTLTVGLLDGVGFLVAALALPPVRAIAIERKSATFFSRAPT